MFQVFSIFYILLCGRKSRRHLALTVVLRLICLSQIFDCCSCESVELELEASSSKTAKNSFKTDTRFASAGSLEDANGKAILMGKDECGNDDEDILDAAGGNRGAWLAVFHYPYRSGLNQNFASGTNCQTVLDRVKNAMMFGASAIIILVLNPKIIKELDIKQLFSKPIVIVQEMGNISSILTLIASKAEITVKIKYTSYMDIHKVSLWSTCGRAYPGSSIVVCSSEPGHQKSNVTSFWNYFFTLLTTLILLLLMKSRGYEERDPNYDPVEQSRRTSAYRALGKMRIRRYYGPANHQRHHDDSSRDTCAICLEEFHLKQVY